MVNRTSTTSDGLRSGIDLGGGEVTTPADYLLMAGFLVYEAPRAPATARLAARRILTAVLRAATARGFPNSDVLETLLANGTKSPRVYQLAVDAAAAVGDVQTFVEILRHAGLSTEGEL
ncbi:hypothetical protein [Paraburkholderia solisilvae]|uniref:Uncharacterized protein n=1 Tax=Paraburkholderia solisilvae TaxID=624376 RepID=A0A6J5E078_9BURK|nr:hypothetical protein [Paraburkholderia solisilvae]CAB3759367.1 hypothetical protein LMG29739_03135 [Paraburkholderia solisilvae]